MLPLRVSGEQGRQPRGCPVGLMRPVVLPDLSGPARLLHPEQWRRFHPSGGPRPYRAPTSSLTHLAAHLAAPQIWSSSCLSVPTADWLGVVGEAWIPEAPSFWFQAAGSATVPALRHSLALYRYQRLPGSAVRPRCGIASVAFPPDGTWTWLRPLCRRLASAQQLLVVDLVVGERGALPLAGSAVWVAHRVLYGPRPDVGQWPSLRD